jgi:molybdopterin converting factor small subunit
VTNYTIEIYSLPREMSEFKRVDIDLNNGASLREIVNALRRKYPALEGIVIRAGGGHLLEKYMFNINGTFYFNDAEFKLKEGDRIALLTVATGG